MFDDCSPGGLLTVVEDTRRAESGIYARRMAAIAALLWQRTAEAEGLDEVDPGYAVITGFARTCAEVGAALNVGAPFASRLVSQAEALDTRLPQIFALLAAGGVDWSDVTAIITRTEFVAAELMAALDAVLAEKIAGWECWSRRRLVTVVDAAVRKADPAAAKERRATADTDRRVTFTALPNGMGRVHAVISAPAGVLFDQRLTEMAAGVCPADPRTLAQRRADAMAALGNGWFVLGCACARPECPVVVPEAGPGAARVVINVIASADTVAGRSQDPGYLDGYGVVDAEQVCELADGGAVLRPTAAPSQDTAQLLRHQPSAAVARWIRCRDLTCSFPGCDRPAWRADLDHSIAFDHDYPLRGGWTMPGNLDVKCRQHHRLKTFHGGAEGWVDQQLADGTVVWTSPTGRVYRSTPDGAELFGDITAGCTTPSPRRGNHRREKTRRIAAAKAGMRAKRAANAETVRVNRARAHEIDTRKWRNNFRRMHLVLNGGAPSTSPWCVWVNDGLEDETLTADWQPPPPPPTSDHDKPPF